MPDDIMDDIVEALTECGVVSINQTPGLTTVELGNGWCVLSNPHEETIEAIPQCHIGVLRYGMLYALMSVTRCACFGKSDHWLPDFRSALASWVEKQKGEPCSSSST